MIIDIRSNEPALSVTGSAMLARRFRSFVVPGLAEVATGNPAAVCMMEQPVSKYSKSEIAKSIGLPMTAFLIPAGNGRFGISYFSQSGAQFQVCGHATAAAIKALVKKDGRRGASFILEAPFSTFGEIAAFSFGETVFFSLPRAALDSRIEAGLRNQLVAATNISHRDVEAVLRSSLNDLLIVLKEPSTLRCLELDLGLAAQLSENRNHQLRGLVFTSKSDVRGYDVLNRAFFPAWGIGEDIACGSANCSSIPYWSAIERRDKSTFEVGYPSSPLPGSGHMAGRITVICDESARDVVLSGCVHDLDLEQGA